MKESYLELTKSNSEEEKKVALRQAIENLENNSFKAKSRDFLAIRGKPIAYWVSDTLRKLFINEKTIGHFSHSKKGLMTGNNARFLRLWYEVSFNEIGLNLNNENIRRTKDVKMGTSSKRRKHFAGGMATMSGLSSGKTMVKKYVILLQKMAGEFVRKYQT